MSFDNILDLDFPMEDEDVQAAQAGGAPPHVQDSSEVSDSECLFGLYEVSS